MKQKIFILITLVLFLHIQNAEAKIWRVNSNGFAANFTTLAEANSSILVSGGDTIYIEGSTVQYATTTLNKKLIIIGPGFFLNENPHTSVDALSAKISSIIFNPGSDGSQLIGVWINSTGSEINASNILIKRCKIDWSIFLYSGITDIRFIQNFFDYPSNPNISVLGWSNLGAAADVIFDNNICKRVLVAANGNITYPLLECNNNVFDCPTSANQPMIRMIVGSFQNNILKTSGATVDVTGGNISYNISASANQFGTDNNNIVITDMSNLFVDPATNTTDGDYQLVQPQPANQLGSDGTDRGAFGGLAVTNHYTLSGLAPIPVIYEVSTSGVATPTGLDVTIKARTIK